jgi:phosphatidylinositol phospholipase C, delta
LNKADGLLVDTQHNTYLTADQLVGKASSMGYTHTLLSGARCVEMDCWNNEKDPAEPKVTHGMTLTTHIPFRAVVKVVREAIDKEVADAEKHGDAPPPPVMISLENHCTPDVQKRLVEIMREEWGDRLVSNLVEDAEDIKLSQLSGKIVCMIEYYGGQSEEEVKAETAEALEVNDSDDEDTRKMKEKKSKAKGKIIPELTALGIYAASVKPTSNNWLDGTMTEPKNHLINVGEGACEKYLEKNRDALVKHNAQHLMRVYPAGMRVTSKNLYPVNFWDGGAQVCALNWQTVSHVIASGSVRYMLLTGCFCSLTRVCSSTTPCLQVSDRLIEVVRLIWKSLTKSCVHSVPLQ